MKRIIGLAVTFFCLSGYALTSGPSQPEYSGFKPSTAEGLVDLLSGDLSYSMPIMEVPGPGFTLPLTLGYTSGVQLEQEASWVGLGWSLSPGAINRQMNRYPDDYLKGQSESEFAANNRVTGWDVAISVSVYGVGVGVNFGERSDQGTHFGLDLNIQGMGIDVFDWNKRDGFDVLPMDRYNSEFGLFMAYAGAVLGQMGISLDNPGFSMGIGENASIGFASQSTHIGAFHRESFNIGIGIKIGDYLNINVGYTHESAWIYKKETDNLFGYLFLSDFPKEYDNDINNDRFNNSFHHETWSTQGNKMEYNYVPEMDRLQLYGIKDDLLSMVSEIKAFPMNTPDAFTVKAEGMNASFRAYRQDIGDYYGMDRHEAPVPEWYSWVQSQWWAKILGLCSSSNEEDIRNSVNAIVGEYATGFAPEWKTVPGKTIYDPSSSVVQFRECGAPGGTFITENWRDVWDPNVDLFARIPDLNSYDENRIKGLYRNTVRMRTENSIPIVWSSTWPVKAYAKPYLPTWNAGEKKVDWVEWDNSKTYLQDKTVRATGIYPKFKEKYDGTGDLTIPESCLVGFTVIRQDGMIYEYHKPVFNFYVKTKAFIKDDKKDNREYNYYDFGNYNNYSTMERPYAYSWLITAIKTPDYVDRGVVGEVEDEDMGSWVRFDYNSHIPAYVYRTPFEGLTPTGEGKDVQAANQYYESFGQATWGVKEIYYLTDIYTPSHHAKFNLNNRNDGKEAGILDESVSCDYVPGTPGVLTIKGLQLKLQVGEVLNCKIEGYHSLVRYTKDIAITINNVSRSNDCNNLQNKYNGNLLTSTYTANVTIDPSNPGYDYYGVRIYQIRVDRNGASCLKKLDNIELHTRDLVTKDDGELVKKVKFTYAGNYTGSTDGSGDVSGSGDGSAELCPGLPNVYNSASGTGKLTLRSVVFGDGKEYLPPYQFSYYKEGNEAKYERLSWDRWGYYKHDGGLIPVNLDKKNVAKWDVMLDTIRNVNSYWGGVMRDTLRLLLSTKEYNDLLNTTVYPDGKSLPGKMRNAVGEALNRMVHDLLFFKRHIAAEGLQSAVIVNNTKYKAIQNIWTKLINPSTPSGTLRRLVEDDGDLISAGDFTRFDSNAVFLLNLGILSEFSYLNVYRGDVSVSEIKNSNRVVMAFLDTDRFDHETNPEDVNAWSLKKIKMPSGSEMSFVYESDDYSFVGRTRAVDHLETFASQVDASAIDNTGYFKRFNMEKDLLSSNNLLRVNGWGEGLSTIEKILKYGNKDTNDVTFRVSTLFRVYRNISSDPANPDYQLNEDFQKLKTWKENATGNNPGNYQRLHLLAMFDPWQFIVGGIAAADDLECGRERDGKVNTIYPPGADGKKPSLSIPIDLGTIVTEDAKGFVFPDESTMNSDPEIAAKYACQRGYVEFNFKQLRDAALFEYRSIQDNTSGDPNWNGYCGSCIFQNGNILGNILQVPQQGVCGSTAVAVPPLHYNLVWARKVDFSDISDFDLDRQAYGNYFKAFSVQDDNSGDKKGFWDMCFEGSSNNCYKYPRTPGLEQVYRGHYSWNYLQEFSIANPDRLVQKGGSASFSKDYWDYYSTDIFVKNEEAQLASYAAGIPGGGLRVKKLVYNSGWAQEKGTPSNARVVEYSYVCEASDGDKGGLSSGATPSAPPPFSNKGDDNPDVPPQVSFIRGAPNVRYGTVHEERKGRGRIVHQFLTSADIADFMADDTTNYWTYRAGVKTPINGAYDVDVVDAESFMSKNHRYRLHKCSHFQGLPISVKKYSENNKLVESKTFKYLTSLSNDDLCNVNLIGRLNGVNSRALDVLISQDDLKLFAGNDNAKLLRHPLSQYLGQTTERFRMKWINRLPKMSFTQDGTKQKDFTDYFDGKMGGGKHSFHDLVGHIEMEVLEHAVRQYATTDLQYAGSEPKFGNGVGTRTINSYFDFRTGTPLITTIMEARNDLNNGCNCNGTYSRVGDIGSTDDDVISPLTTVTIPAYWNYSSLKAKNMLSQVYSVSQYEGLGPLVCTGDASCDPDDVMDQYKDKLKPASGQEHVLRSRAITTWYGDGGSESYKKSSEMHLGAALRINTTGGDKKKELDLDAAKLATIGYPYDQPPTNGLFITDQNFYQYARYGNILDQGDASGLKALSYYSLADSGLYKVGMVLGGSRRDYSTVMTVDEMYGSAGTRPPKWPHLFDGSQGTINTTYSRSGKKSLNLSTDCIKIYKASGDYYQRVTLSFWVRKPADLTVSGVSPYSQGMLTYQPGGPEWQKLWISYSGSGSGTITISGSSGQIDDIRFIRGGHSDTKSLADNQTQVYTMTYDSKGRMTSFDDPNDNIWYYNYDAFGNLIEVKDKNGLILSTQSKVEGRR